MFIRSAQCLSGYCRQQYHHSGASLQAGQKFLTLMLAHRNVPTTGDTNEYLFIKKNNENLNNNTLIYLRLHWRP